MKEKTLKLVAILISIIMILASVSNLCYATEGNLTSTTTGTITINDIEAGIEVSIYKITTVNIDDTANQPAGTPYTWKNGVAEWMASKGYSDPEVFSEAKIDNAEFYNELSAEITKGNYTFDELAKETQKIASTTGTTAKFENCPMGTYLVVIKNGYKIYNPLVVNLTPTYNETTKNWELKNVVVNSKSSTPSITKKMADNRDKASYSTNDEIEFTIEADVPQYLSTSTSKTYKITDTMTNGLSLIGDIKVEGLDESSIVTTLAKGTAYTETKKEAKEFELNFTYDNIKTYKKVKVTYKAKLDQSANTKLGAEGNKNTAILTYVNSPYVESSEKTTPEGPGNTNTVYTYGIDVTKIEKGNIDKKLPGAEFNLLNGNTALKFKKGADGIYYRTDEEGTTTLTTDENGLLKLHGLSVGTYTIKETKAPEGYNIATGTTEVKIVDSDLNGTLDAIDGHAEDATGISKITFSNTKGFQLPVTGGMGTIIFVAGGVLFVGIGITLFAVAAKKRKNK